MPHACRVARLPVPLVRWHRTRNGAGNPVTGLRHSLSSCRARGHLLGCSRGARIRRRALDHSAAPGRSGSLGAASRGAAGRFTGRGRRE